MHVAVSRAGAAALVASALTTVSAARAELNFEIEYVDADGEGFFDQALSSPAEGNPGLTRGAQRRAAFERALEIWSAELDSSVSIRVSASFSASAALHCDEQGAVLGSANPLSALRGFSGAPRADHFYPSALADRLAGRDLEPGTPDIIAQFNPRIDDDDCLPGFTWDYALGETAGRTSFLNTALHELAHGLGFTNLVDAETGSPSPGFGPFDGLLYDADLGRYWDRMNSDERAASARNARGLLWMGSAVAADASSVLALGAPQLEIDDGERRVLQVAELAADPRVSEAQVQGVLATFSDGAGCTGSELSGTVVLLRESLNCPSLSTQLVEAERAGAAGAVVRSLLDTSPPTPPPLTTTSVALPALVVAQSDYDELLASVEGGQMPIASLRADADAALGVGIGGRLLMNATDPVAGGSSLAHWDASVRRRRQAYGDPVGLLMEPVVTDLVANQVDELSVQLLRDIGWVRAVCGDGELGPGEGCDDGALNDDGVPDACRSNCRLPYCGDGVVDAAETCDDGPALGDCPRNCGREVATPLLPSWDGSPLPPIEDLQGSPPSGDDAQSDEPAADDQNADDSDSADDSDVPDDDPEAGVDDVGADDAPQDPRDAGAAADDAESPTHPDAGGDDSTSDDAEVPSDAAARGDAGASSDAASHPTSEDRVGAEGCDCTLAGRVVPPQSELMLFGLLSVWLARRRRASRS